MKTLFHTIILEGAMSILQYEGTGECLSAPIIILISFDLSSSDVECLLPITKSPKSISSVVFSQ